ncbi:MAG: hypothetical protein ACH255_18895 [Candidatus Thiodiazotropha sp.]
MHNLLSGPAIIIDDKIDSGEQDDINNLIIEIEDKDIPCAKFTELPQEGIARHLSGVSFLILDWKLQEVPEGVAIPDAIYDENIRFLKKVLDDAFIPIFIFTSESIESVKAKLIANDLYHTNGQNLIFIENKSNLLGNNLFDKINTWIKDTPSVYVLKEWEQEYNKSKTGLFIDFYNINHSWPRILWSTFEDDNVDPSYGLGEMITKNIHTRMSPFELEAELLNSKHPPEKKQLRMVLSGEKFIEDKNNRLKSNSIASGDVFKFKKEGKTRYSYFLNIRPDCDCISRSCPIDEIDVYLLELDRLSDNKEKNAFMEKYGNFEERDNNTFIFNMYENRSFYVRFKDLTIKTWGELRDHRIGRLLPPYITRVQQRYSLYLQRQGLSRTPKEAVVDEDETA